MDDMESKLSAILSNPEMMQQIQALAGSLNQPNPPPKHEPQKQSAPALPELDLTTVQKLSGLAKQSAIDKNQQALLQALRPYLSSQRIAKLEKAMRAARVASLATSFLNKQAGDNHV